MATFPATQAREAGSTGLRAARLERLRGLYAIVDGAAARPPLELVAAFLRGGARVLQLRLKARGTAELVRVAREAVALCHAASALLLVNDRPDVAALAGADGVHLGQEDLPVAAAREVLGPDALIGLSTHSAAELTAALAAGADYVGFGPVFATATKARTAPGSAALPPPHGVESLSRAVLLSAPTPLVAIGGITAATAAAVMGSGCACVAAIGALCDAADPESAARELCAALGRPA